MNFAESLAVPVAFSLVGVRDGSTRWSRVAKSAPAKIGVYQWTPTPGLTYDKGQTVFVNATQTWQIYPQLGDVEPWATPADTFKVSKGSERARRRCKYNTTQAGLTLSCVCTD